MFDVNVPKQDLTFKNLYIVIGAKNLDTSHYDAMIRIPINLLAVNVLELMTYLKVLGTLSNELTAKDPNHLGLPSAVA